MNAISDYAYKLCIFCTMFELYHLVFYEEIMYITKPVMEIFMASDYLEKSLEGIKNVYRIAKRNKYLDTFLRNQHFDIEDSSLETSSRETKIILIDQVLSMYVKDNPTGLFKFLFYFFIETTYWAILTALTVEIWHIVGISILVFAALMSHISSKMFYSNKYNKYWKWFNILDSILFITLYLSIGFV